MYQQIQKQKKKKKKKSRLLINYDCLTREEAIATINEIRERLKVIFREHIGEEDAITPFDLFEKIYQINPEELDIYKREYWWNILKVVIRQLRSENELFIINKRTKLFVLKNQKEADWYKGVIDRDIKNLKGAKVKADNWVKEEKWKYWKNEKKNLWGKK